MLAGVGNIGQWAMGHFRDMTVAFLLIKSPHPPAPDAIDRTRSSRRDRSDAI
jgi:hypothetical protein